ncbi:MAG: hypothetical protein JO033_20735 [Acidobacteriaceae bacterium]|nr:hypothetical protein [Acidobacteriaceae bacterium]MBV9499317.1 hypothetical protein [Acidobacteriaceae bacterium]
MTVVRVVLLFLLAAALLFGETFKLYLKDGGYHLVREYQVEGDRVRFYSTERGEWEEMPVALVDLTKTEQERKTKDEQVQQEARAEDEETKAERELRREIASIPMDPGAYYKVNDKIQAVPRADYQVITDKKRQLISVLAPVPLIPGKATVVIKGDHSNFVVTEPRPDFYFRLDKEERFGIVRLTPKKDHRIVENVSIIPVAKQAIEDRKQTETFEQELAPGLYRVWPEKPLEPGEYGVIEFADNGKPDDIELLVWDFAYRSASK